MRRYLSDEALPFYSILGDWDEMEEPGEASFDSRLSPASGSVYTAHQTVRLRRHGGPWIAVSFEMSKENGSWMIDSLWIDDLVGGVGPTAGRQYPSSVQDLLRDSENDVHSTTFSCFPPEMILGWIEREPDSAMTPKAVVLNSLLALHQDVRDIPVRHSGCEIVGRFCSPTNPASSLAPSHFAAYLSDYPWYRIIAEWDEMTIHSEECEEGGESSDIVVLLKRKGEEEWTSVNWELRLIDGVWLTEQIWVDDRGLHNEDEENRQRD